MQKATPDGLTPAPADERRCTIVPLLNANQQDADRLIHTWEDKTPQHAREILALPDVVVTNAKDKEVQLRKLDGLDAEVRRVVSEAATRDAKVAA